MGVCPLRRKAEMSSYKKFLTQLEIGQMGEAVVVETLKGRSHWFAPGIISESWIDPEEILCQAQEWDDKTKERKHNKDYVVTVNACDNCKFNDCRYKKFKPYPDKVSQRHEVKTNDATHNQKIDPGKDNDKHFIDEKEFMPTGNLFIEHWQNVKNINPPYPENRKGWFQREPLADWYHFYQPVTPTESDISDDDKKRFAQEMTVTDRLLPNKEFGYIISITGAALKELEPILYEKDKDGRPQIGSAWNEDDTWSKGTLIPVTQLLNNPRYFNADGYGEIIFTPVFGLVSGTRESIEIKPSYYLPKKHHDSLFKAQNTDTTEPRLVKRETWEYLDVFNNAFVWYGEFNLDNVPDRTGKIVNLKIVDGWARAELNGDIWVTGIMVIDGKTSRALDSFVIPKKEPIQFESLGGKIWAISDKFIKAYSSLRYNNQVKDKFGKNYVLIDTKPYVRILKSAKSWE